MSRPQRMSATKLALLGRKTWKEQGALRNAEPIAVVGMGCRYPGGVIDPESLWTLLEEGRDAVTEVPADRWNVDEWYDADPAAPGRIATRWGGFLDDVRGFDAAFFDISPREAERMDPQQRLALEVSCEAVEAAGIPLDALRGTDTGVFFASYHNDYTLLQYADLEGVSARTLTGSLHSVLANRISYVLGLYGPSLAIDSACSSSLVATHLACQALRSRDCDMAIAGGVSVMLSPHVTVALSKGGFMSPTGRCRAFDAAADGFVRSEGCGAVVLKRLADAVADGDDVLAVIRGSAVNQDGESTNLSAPNGLAHERLIRKALDNAGVPPEEVSLVEAHGTGTALGDPIETDALSAVFGGGPEDRGPCYLGSLKTNLGHAEAAAGIGGLIKVVLSLRHGTVPPHVHFNALNPHIDLAGTPFQIVDRPTPWTPAAGARIAGVSSFGVGGTNAHVVLEEAPAGLTAEVESPPPPYVLPLSARSTESLRALSGAYAHRLREQPDEAGMLARATARRRTQHRRYRAAPAAASAEALASALDRIASGDVPTPELATDRPRLCFVFSGQGTQWSGMGLDLFEREPLFREAIERVDAGWQAMGGPSLVEELRRPGSESNLDRTDVAQVALFAIQAGLTDLLVAWDIRPDVVIGHSVGELAAAYASGMLGLDDALKAVVERGRAMQSTYDAGRMISVRATEPEVAARVAAHGLHLSVAALNGPRAVVLSGATEEVERGRELLAADGLDVQSLDVRFGFHSHLMADAARNLSGTLESLRGSPARIPLISTVTGRELEQFDGVYLGRGIASPVRFAAAVETAVDAGVQHFLELGPHPALGRSILEVAESRGSEARIAFGLHRDRAAGLTLASLAGRLFEWGLDPEWAAVDRGPCPPVPLPRYPWNHRQFWLPERQQDSTTVAGRAVGKAAEPTRFPGTRISSPALTGTVFQLALGDPVFDAFSDHRVGGRPRLPATAVLELFRSAAQEAGAGAIAVTDLTISRPVDLDEDGSLQVLLQSGTGDAAAIELYIAREPGEWEKVAAARIEPAGTADVAPGPSERGGEAALSSDELYAILDRDGCDFGPGFQLLDGIATTEGTATGGVEVDRAPSWRGDVHPAVVDACAQLCIAVLERRAGDRPPGAFLPWAVDRYVVRGSVADGVRGRAVLRDASDDAATFDIDVLDAAGQSVARIEGWRLRRAPTSVARLRRVSWVTEDAPAADEQASDAPWLVLGVEHDVLEQTAAALEAEGRRVVRGRADSGDLPDTGDAPWAGVVFAAGLEMPSDAADVPTAVERSCQRLLDTVRNLPAEGDGGARLLVVTRGVQSVGDIQEASSPVGGGVLGLARAIRAEVPELRCTVLDLETRGPYSTPAEEAEWVTREALAARADDEVAVRDGDRLVARLELGELRTIDEPPTGPFALAHESPGTLDRFSIRDAEATRPGQGEVTVEVLAAGLNFRDVLTALGAYPGEDRIGHECSGRVVEVGEGVEGLEPGDRVLVFWPGCFGSHVTAPASFVFPAPAGLDPASAATIPVVFGTAYHALFNVAGLEEGQRVLVHSGAGGVGMAAIQLARMAGAEVYATAGTPEKRALLERMGVAGAFDSRSASFEPAIAEATGGAGVHVVINSLIGELIPAGLRSLTEGGVFVELGKREILDADQVREVRADVRYQAFDLRDEAEADPTLLPAVFEELVAWFEDGALSPLPVRAVRLEEAASAFRRMARAEHVGKIVLVPGGHPMTERDDGWVVITGGLGGLGLTTADWLARRHVRHIALLGRSEPSPETAAALDELRQRTGAEIRVVRADVTREDQVSEALASLRSTGLPITGVIHSAGVLDDAMLPQLTPERLAKVLGPKVTGAWTLHRATLNDPIRLFMLYSAAGPVLSAAGQGNYAAANGFLDALATCRRGLGLPAVSVLWGPWSGGGMAEGLTEAQQARWRRLGLDWWTPATGTAAMDQLVGPGPEQVLALRLAATPPARTGAAGAAGAEDGGRAGAALAERVRDLPARQWAPAVREYVRSCITSILGRETPVPDDAPVRDLGLDSLSAIEVRNILATAAGESLPATLAFDHPTVDAITAHLLERLGHGQQVEEGDGGRPAGAAVAAGGVAGATGAGAAAAAGPGGDAAGTGAAGGADEEAIGALTDEEAEALLWQELQEGGATGPDGGER